MTKAQLVDQAQVWAHEREKERKKTQRINYGFNQAVELFHQTSFIKGVIYAWEMIEAEAKANGKDSI